jgi:hypothetical protein
VSRNLFTDARKGLRWLVQASRVVSERGETPAAQTGWFKLPLDKKSQNMRWDIRLVAPARAFVKTAVGDATVIRFTADRAQSVLVRLGHHHASEPPV